jgi:hypothetical protein
MTNREWLINKMQNMSDEEFMKMVMFRCDQWKVRDGSCEDRACDTCRINWLKAEHKEKPKLSDAERVILENIPVGFCYIARNKDGYLAVYYGNPAKGSAEWNPRGFAYHSLYCFNHLFQFIKWSDNEAYEISELLKGE